MFYTYRKKINNGKLNPQYSICITISLSNLVQTLGPICEELVSKTFTVAYLQAGTLYLGTSDINISIFFSLHLDDAIN